MGRARGRPAGAGTGSPIAMRPIRAALPIVRDLLAHVDETMTYRQLSDLSGYDRVTLSRWRNRATVPPLQAFVDVAQAAGYDVVLVPSVPTTDRTNNLDK